MLLMGFVRNIEDHVVGSLTIDNCHFLVVEHRMAKRQSSLASFFTSSTAPPPEKIHCSIGCTTEGEQSQSHADSESQSDHSANITISAGRSGMSFCFDDLVKPYDLGLIYDSVNRLSDYER